MKTPRTNAQIIALTDAEAEMIGLPAGERRLVPAALAEELETQLMGWVNAADEAQQPEVFYVRYSEAPMRAMQALLTKAKRELSDADLNILLCAKYAGGYGIERGHEYFDGLRETTNDVLRMARENAALKEHAHKLAEQLAECAGVLASVDTERRFRDMHGNLWISQTLDWCKGAKAIGEKANELLEAHDNLSEPNTKFRDAGGQSPVSSSDDQPHSL